MVGRKTNNQAKISNSQNLKVSKYKNLEISNYTNIQIRYEEPKSSFLHNHVSLEIMSIFLQCQQYIIGK